MKKLLLVSILLLILGACAVKPIENLRFFPKISVTKSLEYVQNRVEKICNDDFLYVKGKSQYEILCAEDNFTYGRFGTGLRQVKFIFDKEGDIITITVRQSLTSSNWQGQYFFDMTVNTKEEFWRWETKLKTIGKEE